MLGACRPFLPGISAAPRAARRWPLWRQSQAATTHIQNAPMAALALPPLGAAQNVPILAHRIADSDRPGYLDTLIYDVQVSGIAWIRTT